MSGIFISLGSNLNNPIQQLEQALISLKKTKDIRLLKISSFYRSKPLADLDQPDYINAVAQLETTLSPEKLLQNLHEIETQQGRKRMQRWAARVIDLDLLLYGNLTIDTPDLTIPHPGLYTREFVLLPLFEIAPDLILPCQTSLASLVAGCELRGLVKLVN